MDAVKTADESEAIELWRVVKALADGKDARCAARVIDELVEQGIARRIVSQGAADVALELTDIGREVVQIVEQLKRMGDERRRARASEESEIERERGGREH